MKGEKPIKVLMVGFVLLVLGNNND